MVSIPAPRGGGSSRALCITTRCTSPAQFVETFHRFCDEDSFFVATLNTRERGLETQFAIQLADRAPVLRGLCVVLDVWTSPANPFKRPGIRLGIRRLTPDSEAVFAQMKARRGSSTAVPLEEELLEPLSETPVPMPSPPPPPPERVRLPTQRASTVAPSGPIKTITVPAKAERAETVSAPLEPERTPGSALVLPANPLMNLTDASLEGFIDCTLYEQTANFFRDDPEVAAVIDDEPPASSPPTFAPRQVIATPPHGVPAPAPVVAEAAPTPFTAPAPVVVAAPAPVVVAAPPPPPDEVEVIPPAPVERISEPVLGQLVSTAGPRVAVPIPVVPLVAVPERRRRPAATQRLTAGGRGRVLVGAGLALGAALLLLLVLRGGTDVEARPVAGVPTPALVVEAPRAPARAPTPVVAPTPDTPPAAAVAPPEVAEPAPAVDGDAEAGSGGAPLVGEGPCRLDVATTPAGTRVDVDGQPVGPSPISIAGPCTRRRVELVHPRYKRVMQEVTLKEGAPTALAVTLIRPTHRLDVRTTPPGATVSIGGTRAGTSPTVIEVLGFSGIDVTVSKPGYAPVTRRVYSKTAIDKLSVSLERSRTYKW